MPEQYCNDLHAKPCSSQHPAGTKMLSTAPISSRCRFTAERSRRKPIATSCCGLTQQGLSPLNAFHRAPIPVNVPQHAPHVQLMRLQGPRKIYGRDVRAYIRAPVIPALDTQPYREGEDKASQLQAGKHVYSSIKSSDRHCVLTPATNPTCQLRQGSGHSSQSLRSNMGKNPMSHALLKHGSSDGAYS